jgi:hypothetical protein
VADEYNANAALYRITDDGVPGCVELWKIIHREYRGDLVLTLLDIAQLKQELGMRGNGSDRSRAEPWQNQLSRRLSLELEAQNHVDGSHVVVVLWLRDKTRQDQKGRSYSVPDADLVGAWVCEFQGVSGSLAGNRHAKQILQVVSYKLFRTAAQNIEWGEFIRIFPWLEWFDFYAKHYIWENHVLQPYKRKKSPSVGPELWE